MTNDLPFTAPQTDFHQAGYDQPWPDAPCGDPECDCDLWDWENESDVAAGRDTTRTKP